MSQRIAKLWGLSALATKLLFRQIYCHHQPFTSVDGFLKRLTKNKSLKFEVEFFGNVGALSPTRETKVDDKKKLSFDVFTLVLSVGAERPYDLAVVSMPPGSLLKTASGL